MSKIAKGIYVIAGAVLLLGVGNAQKRAPDTHEEKQLLDSFKGPELFKAYCASCHGKDGSGTAVGKSLQAADLRSPEIQKKSDAELTQSISEGKGNMPAFKGNITDDEIHSALMYVRTLASKADSPPKKK